MSKIAAWCSFLVCLLLWGCSADEWQKEINSGIRIRLVDFNVETKAAPQALQHPQAEQFKLEITNASTGETVKECNYTEDVISLSTGTYDVKAMSGDNPVLALNEPYYEGVTENVRVTADENAKTVDISCKVANALVSVEFDNSKEKTFSSLYASYYVLVKVGDKEERIEDVSSGDTKSAYFRAGSTFEIYFCGRKKDDTEVKQIKLEGIPTTLEAADHLILTLAPEQSKYELPLEISKAEVTSVTITETIPLEWLPKPKVTAEGFTGNELSMVESETPTAKFSFDLAHELQELKFTLNFKDETYQSLNKQYVLSTLSEDDRRVLTKAGVVLPAIGSKEAALDFTGLVAKLTGKDGETVDNVITLDEVKANNRVLDEEQNYTYTIKTQAPEFGIKVYPGNTWTKQFTANTEVTKGNADIINSGMTFEYSLNGSDWTPSESSLIENLTPGTAYQVRGKFGKHVSEVVEVTTYPEISLTNGGLEEFTNVNDGIVSGGAFKDYGAQYEWTGWATLNELTACYCAWSAYSGNSRSSTLPKTVVRPNSDGKTAAWIVTMRYKPGTGLSSNEYTAGELFLGEYNTKGISYESRPTGVHFWYQYFPYEGDKSDIYIDVYSEETLIGHGELQEINTVSSYKEHTISIEYNDAALTLEPTKLVLVFKSGFNTSTHDVTNDNDSEDPRFQGSSLYIDDISLVYDK